MNMKKNVIQTLISLTVIIGICSCTTSPKKTTQKEEATGKWVKYENNPVLGGGDLGTVFDICVLKDSDSYKMYSSWRPQKSIALSTSKDGKNWSAPQIVLPPVEGSSWEADMNRPVVVYKDGLYHMWYTGQNDGKSWIGYAISKDGYNFERQSKEPVLSAEQPWEKVCGHVSSCNLG